MNQSKIEPTLQDAENLKTVERAISMPQTKNFSPPDQRGIHELVTEARNVMGTAARLLELIEQRLDEFDRTRSKIFVGK